MILRASISNTKKFFRKTLESFKSSLSGGYQKLPKTPPFNHFSCHGGGDMNFSQSQRELDKFYTDFTKQWDRVNNKAKKRSKKKTISTQTMFSKHENEASSRNYQFETRQDQKKKRVVYDGKRKPDLSSHEVVKEERSCLVAQKLKELEMMDVSNVEHVLDIEEVLHYYSRLTCPAYLDIVDKFFMEMYSEFIGLQASDHVNNSRPMPRLQSVKLQ